MTATLELGALAAESDTAGFRTGWRRVCMVDDLEPAWGEAALVAGRQVALFRTGPSEVFAVAHQDPATGANVMARGILGSKGTRPTISSPLHKEVYDLETGECFSAPGLRLEAFSTRIIDGFVEVQL
ncbi:nitrite reductase small subunit NirD [Pseudarthrobacter sp. C4D7]|uniref:nitrite reductase small subunit NirD n=1 Tax=Pseudarthrobacter sp. C4D7 TaxID=2735268 RepID=UPI001585CD3F|nr:nitrite reductase small subunit NirD [Pseudarthrobacter sp. C4D7]NUT70782.1 nitrite reductase small subunit NirD [Pseudarthrobacter sp. C4D7]